MFYKAELAKDIPSYYQILHLIWSPEKITKTKCNNIELNSYSVSLSHLHTFAAPSAKRVIYSIILTNYYQFYLFDEGKTKLH